MQFAKSRKVRRTSWPTRPIQDRRTGLGLEGRERWLDQGGLSRDQQLEQHSSRSTDSGFDDVSVGWGRMDDAR